MMFKPTNITPDVGVRNIPPKMKVPAWTVLHCGTTVLVQDLGPSAIFLVILWGGIYIPFLMCMILKVYRNRYDKHVYSSIFSFQHNPKSQPTFSTSHHLAMAFHTLQMYTVISTAERAFRPSEREQVHPARMEVVTNLGQRVWHVMERARAAGGNNIWRIAISYWFTFAELAALREALRHTRTLALSLSRCTWTALCTNTPCMYVLISNSLANLQQWYNSVLSRKKGKLNAFCKFRHVCVWYGVGATTVTIYCVDPCLRVECPLY